MESFLRQAADVGQILAGIVVIVSVPLLWLQVRQQARTSRTELITGMTALIGTVGNAFIDYPEMRQYFYAKRAPKRRHYERARAIAVALATTMDHVAAHFDQMDEPTQAAWKQYFTDVYDNSPIFRETLHTHWNWYGLTLREHFSSRSRS